MELRRGKGTKLVVNYERLAFKLPLNLMPAVIEDITWAMTPFMF